jgi:GNAT superfamily N-acetyltransferase
MLAYHQPRFALRQAQASETSLIAYLRLASLLSLEMPDHSLAAIRAVMTRLPDVDAELLATERYVVAESDGDLLGGAGWSALPLSYRAEHLIGEDGRPACLTLDAGAVLLRGFFLDPDLGRRGAGAGLLAHIEADAGSAGYAAAELVVPATSQLYYRSLGFRPVGKLALKLGREDVLPLLQMRRRFPVKLACAA